MPKIPKAEGHALLSTLVRALAFGTSSLGRRSKVPSVLVH
jgi:hypothetical protein